jgi:2-iminoacetate synthase
MENRIKRRTLDVEDIHLEIDAIKKMNFDSVLLVTGEHGTKVGMKYFRQVLLDIKKRFSSPLIRIVTQS